MRWKNNNKDRGFTLHLLKTNKGLSPKYSRKGEGFTIIEIIVVIAIIVLILGTILGFFAFDARIAERERMKLKAISLAEEVIEAIRNFRDNTTWIAGGIGSLTTGIDYHPIPSGTGWNIISGSEIINGFSRVIVLGRVSRDANDDIESTYNPGNDDSNTRKVTVTITWSDRQGSANESLITYITNWRE